MKQKSPPGKQPKDLNEKPSLDRQHISVNSGREQQGVTELKNNYIIEPNSQIIGLGNFGKVYKTVNKHDESHIVAIKVIDK